MKYIFNRLTVLLIICTIAVAGNTFAQSSYDYNTPTPSIDSVISYFNNVQYVNPHNEPLPVPIEMPVNTNLLSDYIVVDMENKTLQPRTIISKNDAIFRSVTYYPEGTSAARLADEDPETFETFNVPQEDIDAHKLSTITIQYAFKQTIKTSQFNVTLDRFAVMPRFISIQAKDPNTNEYEYLVNEARMEAFTYFPQVESANFLITFKYDQPVRITEMDFVKNSPVQTYFLRFVARSGVLYAVYSMPEGNVPYIPYLDNLRLASTTVSAQFSNPATLDNPAYRPPDTDKDGIIDNRDNCISVANADQADLNTNNIGDACEDSDLDGIINATDNCADIPNPNQQDEDGDKKGDHCDGVESRWIEQFSFLPWIGIAIGFIVVLVLFKFSLSQKIPDEVNKESSEIDDSKP